MDDDRKAKTCIDFQNGNCKYGDKCRFSHPEGFGAGGGKKICGNFAKGHCKFGDRCRFDHPGGEKRGGICHDFANGHCDRRNCKFEHVRDGGRGGGGGRGPFPGGPPPPVDPRPVCRNNLNNRCDRGEGCKYRHATQRELDLEEEVQRVLMNGPPPMGMPGPPPSMLHGKRPHDDGGMMMGDGETAEDLRRKITALQKDVLELRKMNDDLYEQNTRYRDQLQKANNGGSGGGGGGGVNRYDSIPQQPGEKDYQQRRF